MKVQEPEESAAPLLPSLAQLPAFITEEEQLIKSRKERLERKKKKRVLSKTFLKKVATPNRIKASKKKKQKPIMEEGSVRTFYEKIYESYCKLLGQPYLIDYVYCFSCSNYYYYGDSQNYPRRCMVCHIDFKKDNSAHLARPDFILDFNNDEARLQYRKDTQYHRLGNIKLYQQEYMKKVGIIRIDGGIHNKYHVQKKDFHQYLNFRERGVKVFIVQNDDIDRLLDRKDNGKSLLELCKSIGDAVIDEELYIKYTQDLDFQERVKRPFKI